MNRCILLAATVVTMLSQTTQATTVSHDVNTGLLSGELGVGFVNFYLAAHNGGQCYHEDHDLTPCLVGFGVAGASAGLGAIEEAEVRWFDVTAAVVGAAGSLLRLSCTAPEGQRHRVADRADPPAQRSIEIIGGWRRLEIRVGF